MEQAPARSALSVRDRIALVVVQLGVLAVVLAAYPYKLFDLDRYFVAKELALHVTAAIAAFLCITSRRRLVLDGVDVLLAVFLIVSTVSAILATNWWLATRALAVSLSGLAVYWVARLLRADGKQRALVGAVALAATVGAVTSLLQTYGITSDYFSLNRAPGGTFGNRNFVAHVCAIAAPAIVFCALTARSARGYLTWALAFGIISAAVFISRSRAAWLALAVAFGLMAIAAWLTKSRWREPRLLRRAIALGVGAALFIGAAVVLPNTLDWKSDSPYLESMRGVVNYREGSGKGRLVQYKTSFKVTASHPILGVGPGNWAVVYPRYAADSDPSLDSEGMTSNPWPSSDWMAYLSERGFVAFGALVLALVAMGIGAVRQLARARTPEQIWVALALGGTIVSTVVVSAFDAVLLLAAPTLLVWTLLGALREPRPGRGLTITRGVHQWGPVLVFALGLLAVGRSLGQSIAMAIFNGTTRTSRLETASLLDPGSYRIHVRLASAYVDRGDCAQAKPHARSARALFPNAAQPRELLAACGERVRKR
jgi:O-antigen ligase